MGVPSVITDLNATAASNSPAGGDSIGTSLDDYLRALSAFVRQLYDTGIIWGGTATGTNTITFTASPAPTAYSDVRGFAWVSAGTNTGAVTANANSLGAKAVQFNGAALSGGELPAAGGIAVAIYDGTQLQLITAVNASKYLVAADNLSDVANAATALSNLGAAPLASPAFTGTPSLPTGTTGVTQSTSDNSTKLATTAYVHNYLSANTYEATPANPTGTANTTGVMMGLAGSFTPASTGAIFIQITGDCQTTGSAGWKVRARYGTGSAPANAAALTGSTVGPLINDTSTITNQSMPFTVGGVVTGLAVGTAYWIDLECAVNSSGTASPKDIGISVWELK